MPGPQERRFAAYIEGLAEAAGHADRHTPLKNYCKGLLLPGERKSVEPMAARLAPDNVRRVHQSLHHLVADALWNDEEMLAKVRQQVLPGTRCWPVARGRCVYPQKRSGNGPQEGEPTGAIPGGRLRLSNWQTRWKAGCWHLRPWVSIRLA